MSTKHPIVKKAYELNLDRLEEGFLSSEIICHAKNHNEAKSILLKKVRYDNWKLKYSGDELSYLNIPVIRCEEADLVLFEDRQIPRNEINRILAKRERNAEL